MLEKKKKILNKIKATPDAFLVHPLNRANLGINAAAMHRKGGRASGGRGPWAVD